MVGRVAAMLKPFPADRVALELFNEPYLVGSSGDKTLWQSMLETLHAQARQADQQRPIVLNGLQWDSIQGLLALDTGPFRQSNVLYTFHYYDPHAFTHQGVAGQDTAWLGGLKWPVTDDNTDAVLNQSLARIAADPKLSEAAKAEARAETRNYIRKLRSQYPGADQVTADFVSVLHWARSQNLPAGRILLGEFGCTNQAWGQPVAEDRLAWLRAVVGNCQHAGFGWAYWAYKGHGMQLLREGGGGLDPDTLKALGLKPAPAGQ